MRALKTALIPLAILFCSGLACESVPNMGSTQLPEKMPDELEVRYSEDHGMMPTWYRVEIKAEEIVVSDKDDYDKPVKISYGTLSTDQQAELYRIIRENRFDLIENHEPEDIAYDAGGDSISIKVGKQRHRVSSGMNSPISGGMGTNYQAVRKAVMELAKSQDLMKFPENAVILRYSPKKHGAFISDVNMHTLPYTDLVKSYAAAEKAVSSKNDFAEFKNLLVQLIPYKKDGKESVFVTGVTGEIPRGFDRNLISEPPKGEKVFRLHVDLPDFSVRDIKFE